MIYSVLNYRIIESKTFLVFNSSGFLIGQAKKALAKGDEMLLERILGSLEKVEDSKAVLTSNENNPLKNYKK